MIGKQKITALMAIAMMLLFPFSGFAESTPYAVFNSNTGTLTFKYGDKTTVESGTVYDLNEGVNNPGWYNNREKITKVVFESSFDAARPKTCYGWFEFCENLETIEGIEHLNTSDVTDMSFMFSWCSSLTSLGVSQFNTNKVTSMCWMFAGCESLNQITLSNFNTSNVKNMEGMFSCCSTLQSLDLSTFDTGKVSDMSEIFSGCSSLTTITLPNTINTGNVKDMSRMFANCEKLTTIDVSKFNTSNVTNMEGMFLECIELNSIDVSNFNTGNVTNMASMFMGCEKLTSLDLSKFNTENVTNMAGLFSGCIELNSIDFSNFNTGNVKDMNSMFLVCEKLTSLDVSKFNTENVTNMTGMFHGCEKLTSIDVSKFETGNVTSMSGMFAFCQTLNELDISNFDTKNVTDMSFMFSSCSSLSTLDLLHFDTQKVTDMNDMFSGCSSLQRLDVSKFNTTNVTNMSFMFAALPLTKLDISNFNTGKVIEMNGMFNSCKSLQSLDLSNFDTKNVTDMRWMFAWCTSLTTIYVSDKFVTDNVEESEKMFNKSTSLVGAIAYEANKIDKEAANYKDGYFKTYIKIGDEVKEICGSDEANYTVESLDFTDKDVLSNVPIKVKDKITYKLNMANEWGTICLPYEVTYSANAQYKLYKLSDLEGEALIFTEYEKGATIPAGTPMAIRHITESTAVSVTTEKAVIPLDFNSSNMSSEGWRLVGTYTKVEVPDEGYIISKNKFWNVGRMKSEGNNVKSVAATPYHAYIMPDLNASPAASKLSIGFGDGGTTAIEAPAVIDVFNPNAEYYDINGRRISSLEKGINIVKIGGKKTKVIIK